MGNIKDKINKFGVTILKNGRFVFPVLALVLTAVVVVVSLNIRDKAIQKAEAEEEARRLAELQANQIPIQELNFPLSESDIPEVNSLIEKYYECLSNGDLATLKTICVGYENVDLYKIDAQSEYLAYTINAIYKQDGLEEGSYLVYVDSSVVFDYYPDLLVPAYNGYFVKTDENGQLYILVDGLTEDENEYIAKASSEAEVIELTNRINVEYNDLVIAIPEILDYLAELDSAVSTKVGETIALVNAAANAEEEVPEVNIVGVIPVPDGPKVATATTNVNVRKSDSTASDRVGEVNAGDRLDVVEEKENGWTKVIFNGEEAFIKTEFLIIGQTTEGISTIGMMTAKGNVNIRAAADPDSKLLGSIGDGKQLEIAGMQEGWLIVKYEGVLAYVSLDVVEYLLFE